MSCWSPTSLEIGQDTLTHHRDLPYDIPFHFHFTKCNTASPFQLLVLMSSVAINLSLDLLRNTSDQSDTTAASAVLPTTTQLLRWNQRVAKLPFLQPLATSRSTSIRTHFSRSGLSPARNARMRQRVMQARRTFQLLGTLPFGVGCLELAWLCCVHKTLATRLLVRLYF